MNKTDKNQNPASEVKRGVICNDGYSAPTLARLHGRSDKSKQNLTEGFSAGAMPRIKSTASTQVNSPSSQPGPSTQPGSPKKGK